MFTARYYCFGKNRESLKHHVSSTSTALRLRHFFIFCCGHQEGVANDILELLKDFIESGGNRNENFSAFEIFFNVFLFTIDKLDQERAQIYVDLCLQCYGESSHVDNGKGHLISTATIKSSIFHEDVAHHIKPGLITVALILKNVDELSTRSKQALLSFVGACRPPLTRSGTTFPLLKSPITGASSSFINVLTMHELSHKQIGFVVGVISNLPFLEEIHLLNIYDIHDEDFQRLCSGLVRITGGIVSAVHFLTLTFKMATKLEVIPVSTLEPLGSVLRYLPNLDTLHVQPMTYQLFTSLYVTSRSDTDELVVPIVKINLSKADITECSCQKLGTLLNRSLLITRLNLSQNPIQNGLIHFEDAFSQFKYLEVIF